MGLLSDIQFLITEHGSSSILRERLLLINEKAQILENQVADSKARIANLEQEKAELTRQVTALTRLDQFEEHRGAFFKRKSKGGYHDAAYCPVCHIPLSGLDPGYPLTCNRCQWIWEAFSSRDLPRILLELHE